ncbi:amidohydrolase family protein [Hyphococcus luteus]|nr:amidohydrolase family protein [Marinicaulis flavus]
MAKSMIDGRGVAVAICATFVLLVPGAAMSQQEPCSLAVTGVTIIDGNGGRALRNGAVKIGGERILEIGKTGDLDVRACAEKINGRGKYLTPGFVDTNVHVSMLSRQIDYARYFDRLKEIAIEGAQIHLKYGVTTIRDSYGVLEPLREARDAIKSGEAVGADIVFAGNIVGWGGHFSETFRSRKPESYFEEWVNDQITHGTGHDLGWKSPEELRQAMNDYMDLGVNFVKVGLSDHDHNMPRLTFSLRQLEAIVETVHARGLPVEVHATSPESMMMAMQAGVDLIQHPEVMGVPITDEVLQELDKGETICSLHGNNYTGKAWEMVKSETPEKGDDDEKGKAEKKKKADPYSRDAVLRDWPVPEPTTAARQKELKEKNPFTIRENAEKIVETNCIITTATDNAPGMSPEFSRTPNKWRARQLGLGTIASIEALVELGLTPDQAIVAATKNGAIALRRIDELGTIEAGKQADMVMFDKNPLKDISNIRRVNAVIKKGKIVDREALPDNPVYFGPKN